MVSSLVSVTQKDAQFLSVKPYMEEIVVGVPGDRRIGARRNRQSHPNILHISWCRPLGLKAAPGPVTALASFPGSGNTWLRYLLQQATGIHTGSVYRDFALQRNGFPMEMVANGSVLVVKTHEWGERAREPFQAAILLLREPSQCILAEYNRRAGGHIGHASREKFQREGGKVWTEFVRTKASEWESHTMDWITSFRGPLLMVWYSDLQSALQSQLERALSFLGVSVTKEQLECALDRHEGIYRRHTKEGRQGQEDLFGDKLRGMLEERWDRVQHMVRRRMEEQGSGMQRM